MSRYEESRGRRAPWGGFLFLLALSVLAVGGSLLVLWLWSQRSGGLNPQRNPEP